MLLTVAVGRAIRIVAALVVSVTCAWPVAGAITNAVKLDHFGYRTGDPKLAYFTTNPGAAVEIHRASDNILMLTVSGAGIVDRGQDTANPLISGDHVWSADFSALTAAGTYFALSPSLNERSYDFAISDSVYQGPLAATLKAMYYQRCGTAHPATYAGVWSDVSACHLQDANCILASGCSGGYGTLNLTGGWHDAGDYNKYIGGSAPCGSWGGDGGAALWYLLTAYEWNPAIFTDGGGNIPESGNTVPDILDECKWELDWYLKMHQTDGHVLSVVHQTVYTGGSPPSTDATARYYYPANAGAEAIFVACAAHASRVFAAVAGLSAYATTLRSAAISTWTSFVSGSASTDNKFWAAAELFAMDSSQTAARTFVDGYHPWAGFWVEPNMFTLKHGMLAYLQATGATSSVTNSMRADLTTLADDVFNTRNDNYNSGMSDYDYFWSSNQVKAEYAMDLLWAARLGMAGGHSAQQRRDHAADYLHYLNGANPMNMTYMSNAEAAGGAKHGIWRLYHGWFGSYGDAFSMNNFIGRPSAAVDPLYPYYVGPDNYGILDTANSTYGPAPGFVVDGPTYQYNGNGGLAQPPNLTGGAAAPRAKAYRDWNYSDPSGSQTMPWIVNETGIYYITAYTLLATQFVSPVTGTPTQTGSPTPSATPSGTATQTTSAAATRSSTATGTATPSRTPTPTVTATGTATETSVSSVSTTFTRTASAAPSPSPSSTETPSASRTSTQTVVPPTATRTATRSATRSATPSATATVSHTAIPLLPTPTCTRIPAGPLPFPNPVSIAADGAVLFVGVPPGGAIRIYTVSGELVRRLELWAGRTVWTLTNDRGEQVAPGLYYFVASPSGVRTIGRILVVP